jgi:AcrR family transcriptional regulator
MVTYGAPISTRRDPDETKARILDALGRIVVRDGLAAVGVNTLAREAGADKVLIYRYFGDLDGVYAAFAERTDFWWSCAELTAGLDPDRLSLAEISKAFLRRHLTEIRSRPVTLAVLAAEPAAQRTPLVVALEDVRERRSLELAAWIGARYAPPAGVDVEAVSLLLSASLNYLAARSRSIRVMGGVAIRTDQDWDRIMTAMDSLVNGVFADR